MKASIKALNKICDEKTRKRLKFADGTMTVDIMTSSTILCVYNALKCEENKAQIVRYVEGSKKQFVAIANHCFDCVNMINSKS